MSLFASTPQRSSVRASLVVGFTLSTALGASACGQSDAVSPQHAEGPAPAPLRVDMASHLMDAQSRHLIRDTLHARSVRTTFYWARATQDAEYRRSFFANIHAAQAEGLDLLILLQQEPAANRALSSNQRADAVATMMETELIPQIRGVTWELFNEIDGSDFDDLFTRVSATDPAVSSPSLQSSAGQAYGLFLSRVVPRIRAADPTARVISAGVGVAPDLFLRGVASTLSPSVRLDAVAVHAYGYPLSTQFVDDYAKARSAFPSTPVWATEFGMNDGQVQGRWTAAQHDSIQMAEIAHAISKNPGYERAYLYVLFTGENSEYPLYRADWSPRPAAHWVASHNAAIHP